MPDIDTRTAWAGSPNERDLNALIARGLLNLRGFYGDDFKVECPTGSGNRMTLFEIVEEISADALETPKEKLHARLVREQVGGE